MTNRELIRAVKKAEYVCVPVKWSEAGEWKYFNVNRHEFIACLRTLDPDGPSVEVDCGATGFMVFLMDHNVTRAKDYSLRPELVND